MALMMGRAHSLLSSLRLGSFYVQGPGRIPPGGRDTYLLLLHDMRRVLIDMVRRNDAPDTGGGVHI